MRSRFPKVTSLIGLALVAALLGCTSDRPAAASPTSTQPPASSPTATFTPSPLPPTATPSPTEIPPLSVCSPLEGYDHDRLLSAVAVPFHPPVPGSDDPHHGVDLAQMDANRVALAGLPVHAVLAGRVAMVTNDRFPYGNAVLIETPLDEAAALRFQSVPFPTPAPTLELRSALTCPAPSAAPSWNSAYRSLYLLYAHLQNAPTVQPGQEVACGETLGAIGSSGNALNPHLHLEVRAGPSAATFSSMAHYDASASPDEMATYCLWRISGVFQMVDPMEVLGEVGN